MNILFVCTGNISRSFLAKALMLNEIANNHIKGIEVSSAGTGACPGAPADPEMVKFLKEKDIPKGEHSSRMISEEDVNWADLILVMETFHYDYIIKSWPESGAKIEMLGKYIAPDHFADEIIDPYGRSIYQYRVAQSQISLAISNLLKAVSEKI